MEKLNVIIDKKNVQRAKNFRKPIRKLMKWEFVVFHALLIAASAYSSNGVRLWREEGYKKGGRGGISGKRSGLSEQVDFSKYMWLRRFKEIKSLLPLITIDESKKDTDDWYKFKTKVEEYIEKRKKVMYASHILVFDESMSAFIPR